MEIESERLLINKFTISDVSEWAKIEKDPEVRRFVDGKVLTFKEAKAYIEMILVHYDEQGFGRYAVRLKENQCLIGMCGFLKEPYGIDFGYRYSKSIWGIGIGYEVAQLVLDHGLSKFKFKKIYGLTAEENIGSIRILEKLGFSFEKPFIYNNIKAIKYCLYNG